MEWEQQQYSTEQWGMTETNDYEVKISLNMGTLDISARVPKEKEWSEDTTKNAAHKKGVQPPTPTKSKSKMSLHDD